FRDVEFLAVGRVPEQEFLTRPTLLHPCSQPGEQAAFWQVTVNRCDPEMPGPSVLCCEPPPASFAPQACYLASQVLQFQRLLVLLRVREPQSKPGYEVGLAECQNTRSVLSVLMSPGVEVRVTHGASLSDSSRDRR